MKGSSTELEARARRLENSIGSKPTSLAALSAAIDSAELYMRALEISDVPDDRKRLETKFNDLIKKADHLKTRQDLSVKRSTNVQPLSKRKLTTRENIILLEGSKLNGCIFKPWERPPLEDEFVLKDGADQFTDSNPLPLSQTQLDSFGGWKRPKDALALISITSNGRTLANEPVMSHSEKVDLVQDLTSDCSVVASLCAGTARVERGHTKLASTIVYPFDHSAQLVSLSPNGKYVFRLYFNGCWRRVEIDDTLPTSTNSRLLHVVDRAHPGLIWPALTEKAYLKVRGGYDFPGSNSGTDLAVLSGWIPQQVFLHDDDVEPDHLWEELIEAFNNGNIFLTIGTGKLSRREQKQLGLAAEHDYAILDMKESVNAREMLIKNPWADGDVWKGASRRKPNPNTESYPELPPVDGSDEMLPGSFWMDFSSVFQYYENLYVNWNPGLFNYREDRHFSWNIPERRPASTIFDNHPQFAVTSSPEGDVWLLLNRHFRTGDYTQSTSGKNGYISLYLFSKTKGHRVLSNEDAVMRGPFVDSPNTLLRFSVLPKEVYTAVVVQQDLPTGKHNFTISAYSNKPITLTESPSRYSTSTTLTSAWTRSNSGGNSDSVDYLSNPQFKITLQSWQYVAFILRVVNDPSSSSPTDNSHPQEIHVKSLLTISPSPSAPRITRLRPRDIKAHTGDYRLSACVLTAKLPPGTYTLICSTFEEQRYSKFTLDFHSSSVEYPGATPAEGSQEDVKILEESRAKIEALPSERAGRLSITTPPLTFSSGVNRILAPVSIPKTTKLSILLRHPPSCSSKITATSKTTGPSSSLFKITLEQGQGPYKKSLADSSFGEEEFQDIKTGLRIEEMLVHPEASGTETGGLWVVVERLAQGGRAEGDELADGDKDGGMEEGGESRDGAAVGEGASANPHSNPHTTATANSNSTSAGNETVTVEFLVEERVEVGAWGVGEG